MDGVAASQYQVYLLLVLHQSITDMKYSEKKPYDR